MKKFEPHFIDLGFFELIEEYVSSGNLRSKGKFKFYPFDFQRSLKCGFSSVGDADEFLALEKECLIRFRAAHVQLTMKNLFYRGDYVNTSFSVMPKKVELTFLLKILNEIGTLNRRTSRVLYLGDIDEGAFAYDNLLIFRFGRIGDKYYLSSIETSYGENEDEKRNQYFSAVFRSMDKINSNEQLK
ncbi:hypothetical protein VLK31_21350 [Variovorax sp. H27-G14]|uniref:hypothetical protein n=1 Tax=Variovorax sp. H27-G14 TaxID=3111914 RepID=UPI0038FC8E3C